MVSTFASSVLIKPSKRELVVFNLHGLYLRQPYASIPLTLGTGTDSEDLLKSNVVENSILCV